MKTHVHSKKIYFLFFLYIIPLSLAAQPGFVRVYNALVHSSGWSIEPAGDGGFIMRSLTRDSAQIIDRISLIKIDSSGTIQWGKVYSSVNDLTSTKILPTHDKGYIITGIYYPGPFTAAQLLLFKTDSLGNPQWARTFIGMTSTYGNGVAETPDSGFIVCGSYQGWSHSNILLMKTDAQGNLAWSKIYQANTGTSAYYILPTPDSGYVLGGGAWPYSGLLLLKINGTGNILWSKKFIGDWQLANLRVTKDSGFIVCGSTKYFGAGGNRDVFLAKTDSFGNVAWSKTYGRLVNEFARGLTLSPDGGYVFSGYKQVTGSGEIDATLVKTDSAGNVVWSKLLKGFSNYTYLWSPVATADSGFLFCGRSAWGPFNDEGILLVKTNQYGNTSCYDLNYSLNTGNAPFNPSGYAYASPTWTVTVDTVILNVINASGFYDACAFVGTPENNSTSPFSIFPNPSRGSFVLKSTRHFHHAYMTFRNTMGEIIFTIQLRDESEQNINAGMLPAGLYFVEVTERDIIYRDKVMIIKN